MNTGGRILRIFEVQVKDGHVEELLENFATTSADVVNGHPGSLGYFFGRCIQGSENMIMFVSVWDDLNAIKTRFGEDWEVSYLPEGYEDLIDHCSIKHIDVGGDWHV